MLTYVVVGGANTVINLFIYYVLLRLGVYYIFSNLICFFIGVIVGYFANALIVFKRVPNIRGLMRYLSIYCISITLNVVLLYSFVNYLQLNPFIGQIITVGLVTIINYFLIKKFVYKLTT